MKNIVKYLIFLLVIPAVILLGVFVFKDRQYAFIALIVAVLACVPFFIFFEKNEQNGKLLVIIACMIALCSLSRFVFAALPHFKPVTALVIITAMYFGPQAGFVTGAMTAVISNFYFGQGPWTPFQMFAWGLIGLIAGLIAPIIKKRNAVSMVLLCLFGAFCGALYSLLLDTWTTIWWDGGFNLTRFITSISIAAPVTLIYAASNVVFLAVFAYPMGRIFERIKTKYGIERGNEI